MIMPILEAKRLHSELINMAADNPIWYEAGRNIVRIARALKKIDDIHKAERKIVIDKYAQLDEHGGYVYTQVPDPRTGRPMQAYEFGENKALAIKLLDDIDKYTLEADPDGKEIMVEIEIFTAKKEHAEKLKEMNFHGLAYAIEYMGI